MVECQASNLKALGSIPRLLLNAKPVPVMQDKVPNPLLNFTFGCREERGHDKARKAALC